MLSLILPILAQAMVPRPEVAGAGYGQALAADEHTLVVLGWNPDASRARIPMLVYELDGEELPEPTRLEVPARARVGGLAVDGGRIAVGICVDGGWPRTHVRGLVVLFERGPGRAWSEVARVRARGAWSQFGESLDLDGDTLVVGAPGASSAETPWGAVQVFRLRGG